MHLVWSTPPTPVKAASGVRYLGTRTVAHLYPALTVCSQQGSFRAQGAGHPPEVGAGRGQGPVAHQEGRAHLAFSFSLPCWTHILRGELGPLTGSLGLSLHLCKMGVQLCLGSRRQSS